MSAATYRLVIDGSVWDEGLDAAELVDAVRRAAGSAAESKLATLFDHEVGEAEVEVDPPEGGLVGEWSCAARVGHQGYDVEEAWGVMCRRPVWEIDGEEIVDVLVELVEADAARAA